MKKHCPFSSVHCLSVLIPVVVVVLWVEQCSSRGSHLVEKSTKLKLIENILSDCVGSKSCARINLARYSTIGDSDYRAVEASQEDDDNATTPTKRVDFLWRKRLKDLEFLVLFLVVTGIPLLFILAALILTDSSLSKLQPHPLLSAMEESSKSVTGDNVYNGWGEVSKEIGIEEPKDLLEVASKVAFTKDILRVGSQSLNLASNTIDLFNTLRGLGDNGGSDGGDGGGGGGGGFQTGLSKIGNALANDEKRSSSMKFVSKLLQLSTTSIMFILQILNY